MMDFRGLRFILLSGTILLWCATLPVLAQPSPPPDWMKSGGSDYAQFGTAVARAGDVDGDGYDDFLVGAPFQDSNVGGGGAAYLFLGGPTGPETTPSWSFMGTEGSSEVGFSLTSAGDINHDGYDDIAVGAPRAGGPGRVFIFMGGPDGLSTDPAITLQGYGYFSYFGLSVAAAGDVNGDGYDDLIVGAPYYRAYSSDLARGQAYVYLGSAYGLSNDPATTLNLSGYGGNFGFVVAGSGDIDGDGRDDVLVGDPYFDTGVDGTENRGKVSLFRGSTYGVEQVPTWSAVGFEVRSEFGASVSGAGDVNGDGFPDIVIGSPWWDPAFRPDRDSRTFGRVDVWFGSATGLGAAPGWSDLGTTTGESLGFRVAGGADVNGDGFDDILAGTPGAANPEDREGRITLYYGSASGPGAIPAWHAESNRAAASWGLNLAFAGDTDGDGLPDILLASTQYNVSHVYEGAAFLYFGRLTSNVPPTATIAPIPPQECTSPSGAIVLLDGSLSVDPNSTHGSNDDIVEFDWYEGYGTSSPVLLGSGETLAATLAIGTHVVTLDVVDAAGEHATAQAIVVVDDTVPPVLSVTLTPALLWPPNHRMVVVKATVVAADSCGGATSDLVSVLSNEPDDAPGGSDGHTTGDIAGAGDVPGDTVFQVRAERNATGSGRVYTVTYVATDTAGNVRTVAETIVVPLSQGVGSEPLLLKLQEGSDGTEIVWTPVPGASSYDVVRGDLAALVDAGDHIDIGAPLCLAAGLTQVPGAGLVDAEVPATGHGFFYLAQYRNPEPVTFGTESAMKPRIALAGGCP
jgi:FG-GAP repeat/FG-GAP-like repeat